MDLEVANASVGLKKITFIMACRNFFGMKPGQQLKEFADEVRGLSPQDKSELITMFRSVGYDATLNITT